MIIGKNGLLYTFSPIIGIFAGLLYTMKKKKYIGYRIRLIPKLKGEEERRVHESWSQNVKNPSTFALPLNMDLKGVIFPKEKAEKEAKEWREVTTRDEVRLIRVFRYV